MGFYGFNLLDVNSISDFDCLGNDKSIFRYCFLCFLKGKIILFLC